MIDFLKSQFISQKLIDDVIYFRNFYKVSDNLKDRIPVPRYRYYGKDIWEMAIVAVLQGEHILLSGHKATGKNVLAENLATLFNRPSWNVSFNVNTDSSTLIGTDTFVNNEVRFRDGIIMQVAKNGGFGILDEINMAKNDAVAVLHSALDYRRVIDIPGYERQRLSEETRFIATMNFGYAGTKELNEALVSRFMVIDIPPMDKDKLKIILKTEFENLSEDYAENFSKMFSALQLKSQNGEISSKSVDLRGLLGAIRAMEKNLPTESAISMGIVGKSFDEYEKELVRDTISIYLPKNAKREDIFTD